MATFKIVLDKRTKLRNNKYNLAIRMVNGNNAMYINVSKMTENRYDQVFIRKLKDKESIQFRKTCKGNISKCERIFSEVNPFNKERFRELFKNEDKSIPQSFLLTELFDYYIEKAEDLRPKTKDSIRYTKNRVEEFKPGISVGDVTVCFLKKFEKNEIENNNSQTSINHHMRNLRAVINYFRNVVKVIPKGYEYPFRKGGFTISSFFPSKQVLKEAEIKSIIGLNEFKSK